MMSYASIIYRDYIENALFAPGRVRKGDVFIAGIPSAA